MAKNKQCVKTQKESKMRIFGFMGIGTFIVGSWMSAYHLIAKWFVPTWPNFDPYWCFGLGGITILFFYLSSKDEEEKEAR